jgi:hypothetical protein
MPLDNVEQFTTKIHRGADNYKRILTQAHSVDRYINVVATTSCMQSSRDVITACGRNQPLDIEKEIFARSVITHGA